MPKTVEILPGGVKAARFLNPVLIAVHLWKYRDLIRQLTWREVAGRYKGSFIGLGWSFVQPLMMLCIYTFVFSVIFKSRWGTGPDEGNASFAIALFMGMITFSIFSEVANSSPTLVIRNVNYVKKVVFPLEILPFVTFLTALINAVFSLCVLFLGILVIQHSICWTALLLPFVWIPVMLFSLGCGYFFASIGVFIRDLGFTINIITTMLFFLTPIFYPISAIPEKLRFVFCLNPIAIFVEDSRRVVLWGQMPDWPWFFGGLVFSLLVFVFGFVWFVKSKKAFADVI